MNKTIIHFDTETTGTNITKDRIIQLSLIKTDLERNFLEQKDIYINNDGVPIHQKAFEAHGITEEFLKDKPKFSSFANKIFPYFNDCDFIAGYNIKTFDVPLLYEEFARCGFHWIPKPIIDSCIIFKRNESRTLSAAKKFYCNEEIEGAHNALNDVKATIDVLNGQILKYGNIDLISESQYEGDDRKLTLDGRIILNENNEIVWNFGKNKGMKVTDDKNYSWWVLSNDFPLNTKNFISNLYK